MADNEFLKSKRIGRPPTGKGVPVLVRIPPEDIAVIDWYIADYHARDVAAKVKGAKPMTRPEAVRRLLQSGLEHMAWRMPEKGKQSKPSPK